jgi:hypothetical protein
VATAGPSRRRGERPARPAAWVALAAARAVVATAIVVPAAALWLETAWGEVPRGPVFAQGALPAGAAWAVDPHDPGPNLPPAGRSLFDFLTMRQEGEAIVQRVPFPFAALLATLEERLGRRPEEPSPLKRVLIPLGRSLQRNAADPEFFRYPRAVVGVDTELAPGADGGTLLKDRLFLGYHEKAAVLEVISYNEAAGRFEFQLVRDYRLGGEARVIYANRAVCTACHQGGGPLFARQLWDETNANRQVARLLTAQGRDFYGLPVAQGVDVPYALDAATDRAGRFAVYQLLWREGCGGEAEGAVRCRAAALVAALQHLLSGGLHHDSSSVRYREGFLAAARRVWAARWPQGLAIPDPDIPNRDPLAVKALAPGADWVAPPGDRYPDGQLADQRADAATVTVPATLGPDETLRLGQLLRRSHVPAQSEPLNPRLPLEVWTAAGEDGQGPARLVAGLAELLSREDARRLDAALFDRAARAGAPRERRTWPCAVRARPWEGGGTQVKFRCGAEAALAGRLYFEGGRVTRGTIERLEEGGSALRDLQVAGGTVRSQAGRLEVDLAATQPLTGLHARRPDGDALERVRLAWPAAEAGEEVDGEAEVVFRADFDAAEAAVEALAARTLAGRLDVFSARPFRRTAVLQALFAELGMAPPAACCLDDAGMPPPLLDAGAAAHPDDFPEPAIKALYRYCATCHAMPEPSPPNFLYGDVARVRANLGQCAERIFYRLDVWRLPAGQRPKTPMPPVHALASLGLAAESWPDDAALALLREHAAGLVRAEAGAAPRLEELAARGYENLRRCVATTPDVSR